MKDTSSILDQYKVIVVSVSLPHFGYMTTMKFLDELAIYSKGEVVVDKKTWHRWHCDVPVIIKYRFNEPYQCQQFVKSMDKIFNKDYLSYIIKDERRFVTENDLFAYLVNTIDWYYDMSDDHRVWSAGEYQYKMIKSLGEKLIKDGKRNFVMEVMPWKFRNWFDKV